MYTTRVMAAWQTAATAQAHGWEILGPATFAPNFFELSKTTRDVAWHIFMRNTKSKTVLLLLHKTTAAVLILPHSILAKKQPYVVNVGTDVDDCGRA